MYTAQILWYNKIDRIRKKSVKGGGFVYLLKDKTDIKIFILYLLMNMERPVDLATLNDIVVQDDFVGQFDFMDCFYELCETDAIIKTSVDGTECYAISEDGRMATEALQSDLLKTIREKGLRSAKRMLSYRAEGKKSESTVIKMEDGRYRLECSIRNRDGVYMQTSVVLPTKRDAELMKYNFDDRADLVYKGIMSLLSGDMNYLAESWQDEDREKTLETGKE